MRLPTLVMAIALIGCKDENSSRQRLAEIESSDAISIQLDDAVGVGAIELPIRQVNSFGVGIPGGSATIAVRGGGSLATNVVEFDAYGYGNARINVPEDSLVDVQVQSADNTDEFGTSARIYGINTAMPDLPLSPAFLTNDVVAEGQWLVAGTGGVAAAGNNEVWWVPMTQGELPHQVADLPYFIDGIWGAHIDADAIADLVIWADTHVLLLRGRPGGGYGWGAAWTAGDRDIAGVVANDVNGDRLTDLVVAISTDEESLIEVLIGDGRWSFTANEPLALSYPVDGVTASDEDRNGDPDITVLSGASGVLRRYTVTEEGWVGGSPADIAQYKADPGSVLLPPVDLNNQGAPEIAVVGPSDSGEQALVFYVLGSPPTKYPLGFEPFEITFADLDGDGADDLIALEDDVLNAIRFAADGEKFISQSTMGMGEKGPIAAQDFTGDGLADLVILSGGLTLREGTVPDIGGWSVTSHGMRSYDLDLFGPTSVDDVDGDGSVDVLGITNADELPEIRAWSFVDGTDGLPALQTAAVVPLIPGLVLDFAHCGNNVYTLLGGLESQTLHRVKINATAEGFTLDDMWGPKEVSGDVIACGQATSGSYGVAVASFSGDWTLLSNDGTQVDAGNNGPTAAIAMADTNGDGVDEVNSCSENGCNILAVDLNGDGKDELVESMLDTTVETNTGVQHLNSRGSLSADDVDGDGRTDLLTFDEYTGTLSIHRGIKGGLAPAWSIRTERDVQGPAFLADVNQDGSLEFVSVDSNGKLLHTSTDVDQDGSLEIDPVDSIGKLFHSRTTD
jgi:hypothetical protein